MAAQHPVDAVACDGLPESVEEDELIGRTLCAPLMLGVLKPAGASVADFAVTLESPVPKKARTEENLPQMGREHERFLQ